MEQRILSGVGTCQELASILREYKVTRYLLVCGSAFPRLPIADCVEMISLRHVVFDRFTPNPRYEDILDGVRLFRQEQCDGIVAIGGGSAIDVAKCIKLFSGLEETEDFLRNDYVDTGIPLIAVPTTAGSGSESTPYAVIYQQGKKISITHASILPDVAILDCAALKTLPLYQKKCTMLDALCQGIEAWWSVNSTKESRVFSKQAVEGIRMHWREYLLKKDDMAANEIMLASNIAGQAIAVTQTTAAHAMCYQITSMYGIPHGHAVALCLPGVWRHILSHPEACIDPRGSKYVARIMGEIAEALGESTADGAVAWFDRLMRDLELSAPESAGDGDVEALAASVNLQRLKNTPVELRESDLQALYRQIFRGQGESKTL